MKSRDLDAVVNFPPMIIGVNTNFGGGEQRWKGKQVTVSEGHRKSPRTGKYEEGGPFFTYRMQPHISSGSVDLWNNKSGTASRKYRGPAVCPGVPSNLGGLTPPKEDSKHLDPIGAEAIAAINPTNPNAQTGVALGEILKDRRLPIPGINAWKRRTEVAKAAGGEYLNAVFGWLPLVNDMKNTAQSVLDGNTIMENYSNASGTWVHREFGFPEQSSESTTVLDSSARPSFGTGIGDIGGSGSELTVTSVSSTRRWFSGAFTYQANNGGSSFAKCLGIGSEAEKLFGISLTPEMIWELTPWSWAIDWFSNAQSVIHNVSSFEIAGLVMQYGYMMEETSITNTYNLKPYTTSYGDTIKVPSCSFTYTCKRRREANPFGFGVSWDGLSPTQLAITAALGITRLR